MIASGLRAPGTGPVLYIFALSLVAAINPFGLPLLPAYLMLAAPEAGRQPLALRAMLDSLG